MRDRAFLQRQGGASALANALAAATDSPTKRAAEIGLRLLSASGRRNDPLAWVLNEAAGYSRRGQKMTPAEMVAFVAEVRAHGGAKAGADVFRRPQLGCAACHSVNGEGVTSVQTSARSDPAFPMLLFPDSRECGGWPGAERKR